MLQEVGPRAKRLLCLLLFQLLHRAGKVAVPQGEEGGHLCPDMSGSHGDVGAEEAPPTLHAGDGVLLRVL